MIYNPKAAPHMPSFRQRPVNKRQFTSIEANQKLVIRTFTLAVEVRNHLLSRLT